MELTDVINSGDEKLNIDETGSNSTNNKWKEIKMIKRKNTKTHRQHGKELVWKRVKKKYISKTIKRFLNFKTLNFSIQICARG